MLKNQNIILNLRTFFQNNMHLDFILKKIIILIINILLKISVFFLEKFVIEFLFKNIKNNKHFYILSPKLLNFNLFFNLILLFNLILIILII